MKSRKKDQIWYNAFYKKEQLDFPSWYVFSLNNLKHKIKKNSKVLEIGCGQSKGLRWLKNHTKIREENIFGIDQSREVIKFSKQKLPNSNLKVGDAYKLNFEKNSFDFVLLMEVIEHLENPELALKEIHRILKPSGKLYLSFPNYFHLLWFLVRILSEKLNKPNWIVLQPIDKIYNTFNIISFAKKSKLKYKKIIGSCYFPPILYKYENKEITSLFNQLKLSHFSFHPILIFEKEKQ